MRFKMRFFICDPLAKKRAPQKMERPRVLHIFLRSCQQELNNIICLRIQIYVSVCPLKPDLEFSLGTGGDGRILGSRYVL